MSADAYPHRQTDIVVRLRQMMEGAYESNRPYSSVLEAADLIESLRERLQQAEHCTDLIDNLITTHLESLRMDTDEDNALKQKLLDSFTGCVGLLRSSLAGRPVTEGTDTP